MRKAFQILTLGLTALTAGYVVAFHGIDAVARQATEQSRFFQPALLPPRAQSVFCPSSGDGAFRIWRLTCYKRESMIRGNR